MHAHSDNLICCTALLVGLLISTVPGSSEEAVIPIWPGIAPGSETWTHKEVVWDNGTNPAGMRRSVRNVVRPTLTPFLPKQGTGNGTAVIVAPGGGFLNLEYEKEGTKVAEWLRRRGVTVFVLKYRLMNTGATPEQFGKRVQEVFRVFRRNPAASPEPADAHAIDAEMKAVTEMACEDGRQAVRVVRRRASEWGVSTDRIGIMGFSAGGMVTDQVAMRHDAESRPDFVAPIYGPPFGEVTVPEDAAPMFIVCADDDLMASEGSAKLYLAWHNAKKPVELHIYGSGGHGFGMEQHGIPANRWIERFYEWLGSRGLLKPNR